MDPGVKEEGTFFFSSLMIYWRMPLKIFGNSRYVSIRPSSAFPNQLRYTSQYCHLLWRKHAQLSFTITARVDSDILLSFQQILEFFPYANSLEMWYQIAFHRANFILLSVVPQASHLLSSISQTHQLPFSLRCWILDSMGIVMLGVCTYLWSFQLKWQFHISHFEAYTFCCILDKCKPDEAVFLTNAVLVRPHHYFHTIPGCTSGKVSTNGALNCPIAILCNVALSLALVAPGPQLPGQWICHRSMFHSWHHANSLRWAVPAHLHSWPSAVGHHNVPSSPDPQGSRNRVSLFRVSSYIDECHWRFLETRGMWASAHLQPFKPT